jgi:hypothetical protein
MVFASAASFYAPVYLDQDYHVTGARLDRSLDPANGGFTSCLIGMRTVISAIGFFRDCVLETCRESEQEIHWRGPSLLARWH